MEPRGAVCESFFVEVSRGEREQNPKPDRARQDNRDRVTKASNHLETRRLPVNEGRVRRRFVAEFAAYWLRLVHAAQR